MDGEYVLVAFAVAAFVGVATARWIVTKVDAWQLLHNAGDDPWARLYALASLAREG